MSPPQPMMELSCVAVIPLLCLLGLIWLWYRVLRKPKQQHAICGHCQYIVVGLETMFCPECGSDFRRVGIRAPDKRGRVEPGNFLAVWTILLFPVAMVIGGLMIAIGPYKVEAATPLSLVATYRGFDEATVITRYAFTAWGGSARIGLVGEEIGMVGNRITITLPGVTPRRRPDSIDLDLHPFARSTSRSGSRLSVYPESGGYRYALASGKLVRQPKGFSPTVVEDWFAASGLTSASPDLRADAADLFALVNAYAQGKGSFATSRFGLAGGRPAGFTSSPHRWSILAVAAFWLIIYVGGIMFYRRVRLRQAVQDAIATA